MFTADVSTGDISAVLDLTSSYPGSSTTGGWGFGGFVVDSDGIAWGLFNDATLLKYDTTSGDLAQIDLDIASPYCSGLADDSSGNLYFTNLESGNERLYKYKISTGTLNTLKKYAGGLVWFICGDESQGTVPTTNAALLSSCSLNGVKWEAPLADYNCFSTSEMSTYALSSSTKDLCTSASYDSVCNVVAELPPYVCTKQEKDALTTYLGVAAANAELLYAALVFVFGLLLDFIGSRAKKARAARVDEEEGTELAEAGIKSNELKAVLEALEQIEKKYAALEKELKATNKKVARLEGQVASIGSNF